jgi:hypothetical protein
MQTNLKNNIDLIGVGKLPPQAIELELAVIGAIIVEPMAIFEVCDIIKPESFYKESHQKIYKAAIELKDNNITIDLLSLSNKLKKKKELDEIGGAYYLAKLTENVASSFNINYHALIIHQEYLKRESIIFANEISTFSFDPSKDLEDILNSLNIFNDKFNFEISKTSENLIIESQVRLDDNITFEPHFISIKQHNKMIGIMSKGNLSAIIGKAKSRKSFFLTMVGGIICKGGYTGNMWAKKQSLYYFDTEQARFHTQKIIERICHINQCDSQPECFKIFNLKQYDCQKRKIVIETLIKKDRPDVIFIDGVRDLVLDFNDLQETTLLMNWLMMLIDKYNCHISLVIHINKADSNPRGHLGSEIVNKCESVISIGIDETDKNKSIITSVQSRGESFNEFGMEIIAGVPEICEIEVQQTKKKKDEPF